MAKLSYDPYAFEMPWRPNYELKMVCVWMIAAAVYAALAVTHFAPMGVMWWCAFGCSCFALYWAQPAMNLYLKQKRLAGYPVEFRLISEFRNQKRSPVHADDLWLGRGFEWGVNECQYLTQLGERDIRELNQIVIDNRRWLRLKDSLLNGELFKHPLSTFNSIASIGHRVADEMGYAWIHGVGPEDVDQWVSLKHLDGHSLIFGTTGAGKTRLFDLIISQCIAREEPVIIIDPKGDKELEQNARDACKALGREDAFVFFHLGRPMQSVGIDPLCNWGAVTEIASRIAALLPQDAGSSPFTSFSWKAVNTIAQAQVFCNEAPTLNNLFSYMNGNIGKLVARTLVTHFKNVLGQDKAEALVKRLLGQIPLTSDKAAVILIDYYQSSFDTQDKVVDNLLSMYEHDSAHFSKMIASLLPLLEKLTSDELGLLLSPPTDADENKIIYRDFREMIQNRCVVYVGLDTLSNAEVGAAVGSLFLADLTAVAGSIYKFGERGDESVKDESGYQIPDFGHINVLVDEAAEVANNPLIQLLNKGRGANFRLFVASQTYADFVTRLGSKDKANQVLGNMNNLISLRTIDDPTAEYVTSRIGRTKIREVQRDQGQNTIANEPILSGDTFRESLKSVEADLVSTDVLKKLPNLEFFAIVSGGHVIKGRIPILVRK